MIIRDKVALGTFSGLIGTIPGLLVSYILKAIGFTKFFAFQLSGGIFLFPGLTDSWQGLLLGGLVWMIPAAGLGVVITYLLFFTGKAYWWLKGVLVSLVGMFLVVYGFLFTLGGATIVPFDFATNISVFVHNVVFGLTAAYLVVLWGYKLPDLV